ncbi:MAG: hypothetical protein JWP27_1670 [Flaviaesturariibacter sp.]|nr:hypothetical protein [Flaviaesturariibacter sp.]
MRKIYAMIVAVFMAAIAQAQTTARISGSVSDGDGKALQAVTVSLLRAKDSSLAKLAVTDKNGQYELVNIKAGKYFVSYTSVGFTKAFSAPVEVGETAIEVPVIKLAAGAATNMAGVTVVSRRPLVETKIDRMVVNVDASPTNAGNTALDVLEKSPGISIDRDGNISLKGKAGVIILVDGKQTYLSGQDLANYLRNLPANQLDQIELMTQPSSKYDASGNSGVINFRTKKSTAKGYNGSVTLSYVQGKYPKSPNSFNFNYRKGRVNMFSNLSYAYWEGFSAMKLDRRFRDSTARFQESNMHFSSHGLNARFGLDYSIDKKTSVGFNLNGSYNPRHGRGVTTANTFDKNGMLTSIDEALTVNDDDWKSYGANVNLRKSLKKAGQELSADADYIRYSTKSDQVSDNYSFNSLKVQTGNPYLLRGLLPQNINIYSAKLDYTLPLTKDAKLEAGAKSSYVKTDNNAPYEFYDFTKSAWATDSSADHFVYEENINAAYVNVNRQYKKWGIQGGVRMEHTHSIATSIKMMTKTQKDYVQLFPTAYASYKMNEKNTFVLSYGRRVDRPNYQDLNPFRRILDRKTYQQGNPYLTPQFTHNVELSHNYRGSLNTTLNYTYTTDIINDVIKQNEVTKETFQTKENIATRRNIGVAVSYNAPVTKWWTTSLYVNVFNNYFEGVINGQPLSVSATSGMANMSQQFRFAKTWNAEVNGWFRSKAQEAGLIVARPMGVVSFGFGKQIIKGKGTLKLNISDPFYLQKFRGYTKFDNIDLQISGRNDTRRVGLNFSYRFAKGQNVQQKKKAGSSQDEQNRVGGGQQ